MVVMLIAACSNQSGGGGAPLPPAAGSLSGNIAKGPMFPGRGYPNEPATLPVAGAQLRITDQRGKIVAIAHTDSAGNYHVKLAPGSYTVTEGSPRPGPTKDLPAEVTIAPGPDTRLDVRVETGIQ